MCSSLCIEWRNYIGSFYSSRWPLKGVRRKPTIVALEDDLLKELKEFAQKRGVPYQVLMRLLVA